MCDKLTPDDLAAIAAFPPERVQHIPAGVVALTYGEYIYDPTFPGDGLRPVVRYDWKRGRAATDTTRPGDVKRRKFKWERQQQVRDMTLARCSAEMIAKALSVDVSTVRGDRRDLIASGALPPARAGRKG